MRPTEEGAIEFKTVHIGQDEIIQTNYGFPTIIGGRKMFVHEGSYDDDDYEDFLWTVTDGETGAVLRKWQYRTRADLIMVLDEAIKEHPEAFNNALNIVYEQLKAAGISTPVNP